LNRSASLEEGGKEAVSAIERKGGRECDREGERERVKEKQEAMSRE
jgi:hypothetical protein